jgi:hypothetical protein
MDSFYTQVKSYLRNSKSAIIYEGGSELQVLIQSGYTLGGGPL